VIDIGGAALISFIKPVLNRRKRIMIDETKVKLPLRGKIACHERGLNLDKAWNMVLKKLSPPRTHAGETKISDMWKILVMLIFVETNGKTTDSISKDMLTHIYERNSPFTVLRCFHCVTTPITIKPTIE
jgi:hypothetical protein